MGWHLISLPSTSQKAPTCVDWRIIVLGPKEALGWRFTRKYPGDSNGFDWIYMDLIPIGSMVLLYMLTWIPSIDTPNVSIYIYTSTMDPMGYDLIGNWLGTRDAMIKLRIMVIPIHCNPSISHGTYALIVPLWCGFNQIRSPIVNSTRQCFPCSRWWIRNVTISCISCISRFALLLSTFSLFEAPKEFSIMAGAVHAQFYHFHDDSLGSFHLA